MNGLLDIPPREGGRAVILRAEGPKDLLLSRNRITDVPVFLEVDKPGNPVPLGEAWDEAGLVLLHAPPQIIRHACV